MEQPQALPALPLKKVMFQPVNFSEQEIAMFTYVSCRGIISVSTDTSNPDSPLWVNFVVLSNFVKLYFYYWNRTAHTDIPLAIEQRSLLWNILLKITQVHNLAIQHCCILSQWVDLQKLMKSIKTTKMENVYLATYPHHEYDILEIEKISLEQSKIELRHNIIDEEKITNLIMLSKLMASQLHGISIP
jgi:hypothetical protein